MNSRVILKVILPKICFKEKLGIHFVVNPFSLKSTLKLKYSAEKGKPEILQKTKSYL